MNLPAQIAVPDSRDAITKRVQQLLRAAGVDGIIPTPREAILESAKLVESGDLDLALYEEPIFEKVKGFFHKAVGKVFGFLDFRRDLVYVDPTLPVTKRNFVTFHEVTHRILPWQEVIYTEDDHTTVTPECKNIFESEANFGAADFLFQASFEKEAADYNVSVASVLNLASRYEASIHATMRRFVERHHEACAVLVLKQTRLEYEDGTHSYVVCYPIASSPFLRQFGMPFQSRFLNPGEKICDIVNSGKRTPIPLADMSGKVHEFWLEAFDTGYSIFALFARRSSRTSKITALFR